jgi:hypothetical protein
MLEHSPTKSPSYEVIQVTESQPPPSNPTQVRPVAWYLPLCHLILTWLFVLHLYSNIKFGKSNVRIVFYTLIVVFCGWILAMDFWHARKQGYEWHRLWFFGIPLGIAALVVALIVVAVIYLLTY